MEKIPKSNYSKQEHDSFGEVVSMRDPSEFVAATQEEVTTIVAGISAEYEDEASSREAQINVVRTEIDAIYEPGDPEDSKDSLDDETDEDLSQTQQTELPERDRDIIKDVRDLQHRFDEFIEMDRVDMSKFRELDTQVEDALRKTSQLASYAGENNRIGGGNLAFRLEQEIRPIVDLLHSLATPQKSKELKALDSNLLKFNLKPFPVKPTEDLAIAYSRIDRLSVSESTPGEIRTRLLGVRHALELERGQRKNKRSLWQRKIDEAVRSKSNHS